MGIKAILRDLNETEEQYGSDHEDVAKLLYELGGIYYDQQSYKRAKELYERCLLILEKNGDLVPIFADTLHNLGNCFLELSIRHKLEYYQEAKKVLERALVMKEKCYGSIHPKVAETLHKLGNVYFYLAGKSFNTQDNLKKAEKSYESALQMIWGGYGSDHIKTASTLFNLGFVFYCFENYHEAIDCFEKVLHIQKKHYDLTHVEIAETLLNIGNAYKGFKDHMKAKESYEAALDILKRHDGYKSKKSFVAIGLSSVYDSLGNCEKVQELDKYLESDRIFTVRGKDRGKNAWHYVLIDPGKKEMFLDQSKTGSVDVAAYGNVLYSGWGENVPQNIMDKINRLYFGESTKRDELEGAKKRIAIYLENRSDYAYIVRGTDEGLAACNYVLIDKSKRDTFLEQTQTGSVDVLDYGKIIYSGWGSDVPQDIIDKMDKFSDEISNNLFLIKEEHKGKEGIYNYVLIKADRKEMFLQQSEMGSILVEEIEDYGMVLHSGLGQDPPECISDRIESAYFCLDRLTVYDVDDVAERLHGFRLALNQALNNWHKNAFRKAARNGEIKELRFFMREGFDVNSADKNGWTTLHYAAYGGNFEVIMYLLDNGADLDVKDAICGRKPVHIAAREGHIDVTALFISRGVYVNVTDKNSWTPLHYAAWNGHRGTAKRLIQKGANIRAKIDNNGKEPIHIAAGEGHTTIVELFLSNGVGIEDTDKDGRTPLYYAVAMDKLETVMFLVGKGANINSERVSGFKPIHAAVMCELEIMEYLISKGASVSDTMNNGWTTLHVAAHFNAKIEMFRFLIDRGVSVHAECLTGEKPIDVLHNSQSIMELLSEKMQEETPLSQRRELERHEEQSPNTLLNEVAIGTAKVSGVAGLVALEAAGEVLVGTALHLLQSTTFVEGVVEAMQTVENKLVDSV